VNPPSRQSSGTDHAPSGTALRGLRQDLTAELTLGLLHKINNLLTRIHFQVEDSLALLQPSHPVSAQIAELSENIGGIQSLLDRTSQINLPPSEQDNCPIYDLEASVHQQMDLLKILLPLSEIRTVSEEALAIPTGIREGEFGLLLLQIACVLRALPVPKRSPVFIDLLRADQTQFPLANLPWHPAQTAAVVLEAGAFSNDQMEIPDSLGKTELFAESVGCRVLCTPPGSDGVCRLLLLLPESVRPE
jgi:hypothetical protein